MARVAGASILAGVAIAVGLLLLILPGLFLITIWCLIVPVIVLEQRTIGAAFGRSRQLVRGYELPVFGTLVMVFVLLLAANVVLALVFAALPRAARGIISGVVSGTLVAPFTALVLTMGYFRLRSTHGGPDDPLERFRAA